MKQIPGKLADPEYVVIRPDGRINAILEMRKKNRPILISVEMEAFLTTTQEKQQDDDTYNLIVTILDARKNYLKNNVSANSRIVENKNNEDPAHFISRLKLSQNATMPTNDHAEPSQKYDTTSSGKVNPPAEGKHSFEIGADYLAAPTEAEYARELAQIRRMDPEMGSLKDVLNSDAGTRFREYIGKGLTFPEAYTRAARERLTALGDERAARAARMQVIEEKLRSLAAARQEEGSPVPPEVKEIFRVFFPEASDAEIQRMYDEDRRQLGRKKGF